MRLPAGSLTPAPAALARVPHLADLDARLLELRLRGRHVEHAERDRRRRQGLELVVVRVRRHDRQRQVACLVLDPVVMRRVRILLEAEDLAVELLRLVDVRDRHADVVDALDTDHVACLSPYGA